MSKEDEFNEALEAKKLNEKDDVASNNLHKAIVLVMQDVKNVDKAMTVGSGNFSYKGVADKDVKQIIGQSMAKHGLTCMPIKIEPTTTIERWQETTNYNNTPQVKQKQSVFTEVLVTYKITHADTGETIDIMGYGHGADAMDKSAGKATTYALKNALLYTFLVPTGAIDDTDNTHSSSHEVPQPKVEVKPAAPLNPMMTPKRFGKYLASLKTNNQALGKEACKAKYNLKPEQIKELDELVIDKKA